MRKLGRFLKTISIRNPMQRLLLQLRARLTGRVFACNSLQGDSSYNICVNADMTVSCNCRDFDGSGHIGNLRSETMEEIFSGEKAQRLRRALAARKFPIANCSRCEELRLVPRSRAREYTEEYKLPKKGMMVENTAICNLKCLACKRTDLYGSRVRKHMPLEDMQRVSEVLKQLDIASISFFNLGEPFLSKGVVDELPMLRTDNPDAHIATSTHGMFLDSDEKRAAAMNLSHIFFSMDGPCQEIVIKYQVGADFERSFANLKALVAYRDARGLKTPVIEWKYVVFRWNDHPRHVNRAIALAREAGADLISFWPGYAALSYKSFRYHLSPFYRRLGEPSWKGREVWLREEARAVSV